MQTWAGSFKSIAANAARFRVLRPRASALSRAAALRRRGDLAPSSHRVRAHKSTHLPLRILLAGVGASIRRRLILLLYNQIADRCVANIRVFMPGNRRAGAHFPGFSLALPRTTRVVRLTLSPVQNIADGGRVRMAQMNRSGWKGAAYHANLGIFVQLFTRVFALPFDGKSIRDFACGGKWRQRKYPCQRARQKFGSWFHSSINESRAVARS